MDKRNIRVAVCVILAVCCGIVNLAYGGTPSNWWDYKIAVPAGPEPNDIHITFTNTGGTIANVAVDPNGTISVTGGGSTIEIEWESSLSVDTLVTIGFSTEQGNVGVSGGNWTIDDANNGGISSGDEISFEEMMAPTLSFSQLNWIGEATSTPDSNWGQVKLEFTGYSEITYFNLNVDSNWAIENLSIGSLYGPNVSQSTTTTFGLEVTSGTDVTSLNYLGAISSVPLNSMPSGTLIPASVANLDYRIGGIKGEDTGSPQFMAKDKSEEGTGKVVESASMPDINDFKNQAQKPNECAQTAISNSLTWLKNRPKKSGRRNLSGEVDTSKGACRKLLKSRKKGTRETWGANKLKKLEDHITGKVIQGGLALYNNKQKNWLIRDVNEGQDVEIDMKEHVAVLAGIRFKENGDIDVDYFDDTQTDGDKADGLKTETLRKSKRKGRKSWFLNKKRIENFVVECPVGYIARWDTGDDYDGMPPRGFELSGMQRKYSMVCTVAPVNDVNIAIEPSYGFDGEPNDIDLGAGPGEPIYITFTPQNWAVVQDVNVIAVDDDIMEASHICVIHHSVTSADPNFDYMNVSDTLIKVIDNDSPTIEESNDATKVCEQGPVTDSYTCVLNIQPANDVTITADPNGYWNGHDVDLGGGAGVPITMDFNSVNWNISQTIIVTPINDSNAEGPEEVCIVHTSTSSDPNYDGIPIDDVIVDIIDNDYAGDFNYDGIVDFRDFCWFAENWLSNESTVDIAPLPFGDGVVNTNDLGTFVSYWLEEALE